MSIALISAYGRKYENADAAKNDWYAGKDFKIYGGPYCSIRDWERIDDETGDVIIFWEYPYGDGQFTLTYHRD